MDVEKMVTEFTGQLKDQKATIVELEKQLSTRKEQVKITLIESSNYSHSILLRNVKLCAILLR